jgi:hypothetical protein
MQLYVVMKILYIFKIKISHLCRNLNFDTISSGTFLYSNLKGQCHETFDPPFFRQTIPPRPLNQNRFENDFVIAEIFELIVQNVRLPRSLCDR